MMLVDKLAVVIPISPFWFAVSAFCVFGSRPCGSWRPESREGQSRLDYMNVHLVVYAHYSSGPWCFGYLGALGCLGALPFEPLHVSISPVFQGPGGEANPLRALSKTLNIISETSFQGVEG